MAVQDLRMGYAAVFLFALAEALAVIGLAVPGTTAVAAAGSAAEAGKLSTWGVVVAAAVGGFAGDALSYAMGRGLHRWDRLERWLARHRAKANRAEEIVRRWGALGVILGRFLAPTRSFVPLIAGSARMAAPRFMIANAVGAVAWVAITVAVGEEGLKYYEHIPRRWSVLALGVAAGIWLTWMLVTWIVIRRRHRGHEA